MWKHTWPIKLILILILIQDEPPEQPDIGEAEALTYVAGWVVRKLSEDPAINTCEKLLVMSNDTDHNYHRNHEAGHFINAKKYTSSSNLIRPSDLIKKCWEAVRVK